MKMIQFNVPSPKNKSVYVQEDNLSEFYPFFHKHEEYQFMWIVKGKGTLYVEDSFHDFEEGDIFLLGPNQPHVFKKSIDDLEENGVQSVSVFFDTNGTLSSIFHTPEFAALLEFVTMSKKGFKVPEKYRSRIKRRIDIMRKSDMMNQLVSFFFLIKELYEVSDELRPLSVIAIPGNDEGQGRINSICTYIRSNFRHNITLEEIAERASLTPQAFCRYFKKHTGLTFVNYLNQLRIEEACQLISAERYESVALVAFNSGFNSITNFNRVFRTVTGFCPKEYYGQVKKRLQRHVS
ncbi:AraC family transcriptional regulator [Sphingobacterium psychroaquaticum]|uniref:AraC-type DNA-binding protein n=2 Tax=Sphingobacterium psychroaquaticum TaxID=561061 RepID=A0A1X7I4A8_9SPHI|nr:AraC family transcriptional regulator [Sphingobacterium psychroaquaticum]SMG09265.1 AraC-type DNA-binding protein [Sphingobacterium psychroaquaticum]